MRTLFWCGSLVTLASAACAYTTACYVSTQPDSRVSRCVVGAYRVGVACNPITPIASLLHKEGTEVRGGVAQGSVCTAMPDGYSPHATNMPNPEDFTYDPSLAREIIDVHAKVVICEEEEPVSKSGESQEFGTSNGYKTNGMTALDVSVEPGAASESEDDSPSDMPPLVDEEPAAPTTMPYIEDEPQESDKALIELWKSLFQKVDEEKASPAKQDEDTNSGQEPSETNQDDLKQTNAPESNHPSSNYCPYTGQCYPAPKAYPAGSSEEQEENPAPAKNQPCKSHKKKCKAANSCPVDSSTDQSVASTKKKHCVPCEPLSEGEAEETPPHPEVDTMEFRPREDARAGEFTPKPL